MAACQGPRSSLGADPSTAASPTARTATLCRTSTSTLISTETSARVDLADFSASGVSYLALTTVDANLKGFNGGFTDGTYGYVVPNSNGNVVRLYLVRGCVTATAGGDLAETATTGQFPTGLARRVQSAQPGQPH